MANMTLAVAHYINDHIQRIADPRVADWFLMENPWPTVGIVLLYMSLVYGIIPSYMKNRKPYKLTIVIRVYNLIQIIMCTFVLYSLATSGWIQGTHSIKCQPVDYSDHPEALYILRAFYWTYFLKLAELLETIFFSLRCKTNQITMLHVYHHVSSLTIAWLACKYIGGGLACIPVMLNSFIHMLMYTYYLISSLGPSWQKKLAPWKPRLTMLQMVQFTLMLIHLVMNMHSTCKNTPRVFIVGFIPNIALIYKMFFDFYRKNYSKKYNKIINKTD